MLNLLCYKYINGYKNEQHNITLLNKNKENNRKLSIEIRRTRTIWTEKYRWHKNWVNEQQKMRLKQLSNCE